MCLGIPMQVIGVEPGSALCTGRNEQRKISTLLVGDCACGDWLLCFLDDAREKIDAQRALEINRALDLLEACHRHDAENFQLPEFPLPSSLNQEQLRNLTQAQTFPKDRI